jgi:hypothetical protein
LFSYTPLNNFSSQQFNLNLFCNGYWIKEVNLLMIRKIMLGTGAVFASLIIAGGTALAQSPSMSATPSPSPVASVMVPSAAPATGFGAY